MAMEKRPHLTEEKIDEESPSSPSGAKKPWQEPKLAFVEPKLTKHGTLKEVTGEGFFGGFTPK